MNIIQTGNILKHHNGNIMEITEVRKTTFDVNYISIKNPYDLSQVYTWGIYDFNTYYQKYFTLIGNNKAEEIIKGLSW